MILENQISILEGFSKDQVTIKTAVITLYNKYIKIENILN